jgi:hypothetical protein
MSTWYGTHFGVDAGTGVALVHPPKVVSVGVKHGRIRYNRSMITGLCLSAEVLRFFSMKSSDRLLELMISSDGGSTAGACDFGIYLSGNAHDGAVQDVDLFASAQAISTAIARTDIFNESAVLQHEDRGKTLWELLAVGAGTDTVDPQVFYDICGTVTTTFTDAVSILVLEAYYTAGD